jgi:hypothetical protein
MIHRYRMLTHAVAQLVEALRYKSGGRGFHFRLNPFGRTMALGSTEPLTEMSTRNIFWELKLRRADKLATFMCRFYEYLGASNSRPVGYMDCCKNVSTPKSAFLVQGSTCQNKVYKTY